MAHGMPRLNQPILFSPQKLPAWKLIDCVTPSGGGGDAKVNSNYVIAKLFRALEEKTAFFLRCRRAFCII
jgi:hypothetical protein